MVGAADDPAELIGQLEASGLAYALGGSWALRAWGVTSPLTGPALHLFGSPAERARVGGWLTDRGWLASGASLDAAGSADARVTLVEPGSSQASLAEAIESERTRRPIGEGGPVAWVPSAEALAAWLAARGGAAREDAAALLGARGWSLDSGRVRSWLAALGPDGAAAWDAIVASAASSG